MTRDWMYNWHRALLLLARHEPVLVAEIVVTLLTGPTRPWRLDDGNAEVLAAAARVTQRGVMDVVGAAILDPSRRPNFGIDVFHDLFEAIGVAGVRRWVDAHGPDALRWAPGTWTARRPARPGGS